MGTDRRFAPRRRFAAVARGPRDPVCRMWGCAAEHTFESTPDGAAEQRPVSALTANFEFEPITPARLQDLPFHCCKLLLCRRLLLLPLLLASRLLLLVLLLLVSWLPLVLLLILLLLVGREVDGAVVDLHRSGRRGWRRRSRRPPRLLGAPLLVPPGAPSCTWRLLSMPEAIQCAFALPTPEQPALTKRSGAWRVPDRPPFAQAVPGSRIGLTVERSAIRIASPRNVGAKSATQLPRGSCRPLLRGGTVS